VVLEAVRDLTARRKVSDQDRASARAFLAGEEGQAWLRLFGIPYSKVRDFIENGHQIVNEGNNFMADKQKVIGDWMIAAQDTIAVLQAWLRHLDRWEKEGQIEPDEFAEACRQLEEARLHSWAREAGGHGLEALARVLEAERKGKA
jgi:hypothetical protein